ncbi:leucine-rich repeat extensin-like protein 2 [Iris pallida]|uniref:Leucine-rich repeat extensin-like protein 2 n=1 Tax=Iris pallida TaxID=29817 RepID=A0AAX6HNZ6_IRIPA|nr:leucine-rich repeat extensin-like protein 2 [Iris pallida]
MDRKWIKLTSISGRGVRSFSLLFLKPSLYAVVSVNGLQKQTTSPDPTGGENPVWFNPVRLDLDGVDAPDQDLVLEFDLMASGSLLIGGDWLVGKVSVPVGDLLTEGGDGSVRHVSYQVTAPDGKPNGVLSFSYKFNLPPLPRGMDLAVTSPPPAAYYPPPVATSAFYPPPPPVAVGYYPPTQTPGHVAYYPPIPPEDVACYPPLPPPVDPAACCYPPPPAVRDPYSYLPENWDRRSYR